MFAPEIFKLHLYNCHCHQIFLGCSHDNGYARLLEDTLADRELTGRISLIEGVPFERELASIKSSYRVTKFDNVFRSSKITPHPQSWDGWSGTVQIHPLPPPPQSAGLGAVSPNHMMNSAIRLPQSTSPASTAAPSPPTWASTTAAGAIGNFTDLTSRPNSPVPLKVERNKYGQRVDRLDFKSIPKDELNRVKKLKL